VSDNNTQKVLLQIARSIALSDGTISEEEERLLKDLPERLYLKETTPDSIPDQPQSLTELAKLLTNHTDQCTAIRVACLVAGVSRNPGDNADINAKERMAYRELIAALQVSEEELSEIQWAVKEEFQQKPSLLNVILDAIYGKDGWPDQALLPPDFPMI
jgi:tellurite resistance protein